MPRRDIGVASATWALVASVDDGVRTEFRKRARALGPMLQGSGLAATAAFLRAKSSSQTSLGRAYRATERGLAEHVYTSVGLGQPRPPDLVVWLGENASPTTYRRASAAAREFATWLKRAAEALIPAGAEGSQ